MTVRGENKHKIYNIGNNKPVKLTDFISILEKHLGKKAKVEYFPIQPGDVYKTFADIDALIRDINYKPVVSIDEGLKKFVKWYQIQDIDRKKK